MSIKLCVHGINERYCVSCPKKNQRSLSEDQQAAVETILKNKGCFFFLTGPAGSGKSFVISHLKDTVPGCEVVAMTGVAAQLIDGRTAHSFLGMRLPMNDQEREYAVEQKKDWILSIGRTVIQRIESCRMLIIDEISMANVEFLQLMIERFRGIYRHHSQWPKIVMVGDFLQLPPTKGDKVFPSPVWREKVWVIKLTQQHRQEDPEFLTALNEVRTGNLSDKTKALFSSRIIDKLPADCVHLHAYNADVDNHNNLMLSSLPGEEVAVDWHIIPNEDKIDVDRENDQMRLSTAIERARKQSRLSDRLYLKEDAKIVLLTNESTGKWVNGSCGTVVSIYEDNITVRLFRNGDLVDVPRYEEDLLDGPISIGKISQFPIRLAFALSIHKSQGMTLDTVGVDLNDHFSPGQTYVALSRCRYLETLYLTGTLPDKLLVDEEALTYIEAEHPIPSHSCDEVNFEPGSLIVDLDILRKAVPKGVVNRKVCGILGIHYPAKAGWRERLVGTILPPTKARLLEEHIAYGAGTLKKFIPWE